MGIACNTRNEETSKERMGIACNTRNEETSKERRVRRHVTTIALSVSIKKMVCTPTCRYKSD